MIVLIKCKTKYGVFGEYANALVYARSRWQDREFFITGSELETVFTDGIPLEL
jgi:hypothetical protein